MRPSAARRPFITGIALIIAPLLGLGLKMLSFGWAMVFVIFSGIAFVLAIGYVVQIVIAAQGFLSKRALFNGGPRRAFIAAWLSIAGVIMMGLFMTDGGDMEWGSTLQIWLGAHGENSDAVHAATGTLTQVLTFLSLAIWLAGWVWLVVEWILGLVRRRRLARP